MVATIQLLSGLVGSLAFLSQASAGPLVTEQVRIMALGDSITGNPLSANNIDLPLPYSGIRFVGTKQRTYCGYGSAYDWPHEGHGGFLATGIASTTVPILPILPEPPLLTQPLLQSWLLNPDVSSLGRPVDIVLMHLGTNDIWQGRPTAEILGAYGALLNQMRAVNPRVRLLVAKILPMETANCPACAAKVQELNTYIPFWAAYVNGQNVPGQVGYNPLLRPVMVVDQYAWFNATRYTTDGVHPNARGDEVIAQKWLGSVLEAVEAVVDEGLLP